MYTECPECQAAFRLTVTVLRQAHGRVRCGGCGHVFDALDYLQEEAADAVPGAIDETSAGTRFERQSRALLESLDELAGPEDIRIEDTGLEWRVLDVDDETDEDDTEPAAPADEAPGAPAWTLDEDEDEDDAADAVDPGAGIEVEESGREPRPAEDIDGLELEEDTRNWSLDEHDEHDERDAAAAAPASEPAPAAADDSQAALDLGADDHGDEPLRYDDNSPLPDEETRPPDPTPQRRADDLLPEPVVNEQQDDLALGDPDDWRALLDEVGAGKRTKSAAPPGGDGDAAPASDAAAEGPRQADDGDDDTRRATEDELDAALAEQDAATPAPESAPETEAAAEAETPAEAQDAAAPDVAGDDARDTGTKAADEAARVTEAQAIDENAQVTEAQTAGDDAQVTEAQADDDDAQVTEAQAADDDAQVTEAQAADDDVQLTEAQAADDDAQVTEAQAADDDVQLTEARTDGDDAQVSEALAADADDARAMSVETIVLEGDSFRQSTGDDPAGDDLPAAERPHDDSVVLDPIAIAPPSLPAAPARPAWPGIAAAATLGLLLSAQLVHANRASLATIGAVQQTLGPLYRAIGKPLTPAWDVRGWRFESTSGSTDADGERLTIYSRIANASDAALPYPLVHVSLTDRFEEVIGSRVLAANDYLAGNSDSGRTVPPGQDFTAVIGVDSPSAAATGFKLNVCYRLAGERLRCAVDDFKN